MGLLHMLGTTRVKFGFYRPLPVQSRFWRWDAEVVARLFKSPGDPKLIGFDCAMFAVRPSHPMRAGDV